MSTITIKPQSALPKTGDKVIPLPDLDGDWHYLEEWYRDKVGTVTSFRPDHFGRQIITAEFQSRQKPDDTIAWDFYEWKPADSEEPITFDTRHCLIGKLIRVRYSGSNLVKTGEVHKVTGVWNHREDAYDPKIDGITVQVLVGTEPVYVQAYEVVEDGETLTVSDPYRPAVGDKVTITGYLSNEGIIDTVAHDGYIRAVDGDIWTIDSPLYGRQVSGPGYIALVLAASEDTSSDAPVLPHEEPRIIAELREEAATLKRELDRANERVEEFRARASKWERDFMRYAERIMQEANDRDWCSEYDRIMEEISGDLEIASIPEREQEVEIEWEEIYTVTVKRSGTATLRAGYDSSDIDRAARDLNGDSDADRSEVLDAVRNGAYESESYVDDSAEEA